MYGSEFYDKISGKIKRAAYRERIVAGSVIEGYGIESHGDFYWENGQRVPNANAVVILAKYFGVTTDYLLGVEE